MKKASGIFSILFFLFFAKLVCADTFDVGGKNINIPSPPGFVPITKAMDGAYRLSQRMSNPRTDQLALYISKSNVPAALKGEIPSLKRYFIVTVSKNAKHMTIGAKEFSILKDTVKSQNKKIIREVKAKMPEILKKISEGISKEFNAKMSMKISKMIPLDLHYESENAFSYSMYIAYKASMGDSSISEIVPATITFVRVADKVIFLIAYGSKKDLEWTRNVSKTWSRMVISSNSQ